MAEPNDPLKDLEIEHADTTEEPGLPVEEPEPQTPLDRLKKAFAQARRRAQPGNSPARKDIVEGKKVVKINRQYVVEAGN